MSAPRRVLVVDDSEENRYLLRSLLEGHGWVVETAVHGAEALEIARRAPPDLVVSDLLMPVMDGYTLLRQWKADPGLSRAPFVVYTATYTDPEDERLALGLGADDFMIKPAEPEVLLERLTRILERAGRHEPNAPARTPEQESELLDRHNRALIRKLSEKTLALERDIAVRAGSEAANRALLAELTERVKELGALRRAASLLQEAPRATPELLRQFAAVVPEAMRFPELAWSSARFGAHRAATGGTEPGATAPRLERCFEIGDGRTGAIEVAYRAPPPAGPAGPFLAEEADLLESLADMLRAHFDRRRAEEALSAGEAQLRDTLESITDAFYTLDREWRFTYLNQEAERQMFRSRESLLGRVVWEAFPESVGTVFESEFRRARERDEKRTFEAFYPPFDAWFSVRVYPSERGLTVYFENVTELRTAREELRVSEERFRLLAKATNDAIWDWDLKTDRRWWNEGFETLFGYRRGEVEPTSESWSRRLHPEDRAAVTADLRRAIDEGRDTWSSEYRFLRRDGRSAHVLDRGQIIRDEGGAPLRMIGGMTDLTERKELEARFFRAQRMESIGTLAGGIAHDLNNVLAPILMSAGLLKEVEEDPERVEMLQSIEHSAQRGADMVRQVLAFARGVEGRPVALDLWHPVREVQKIVKDTFPKSIELVLDGPRDLWTVQADATQLHQVLVNLCVNARDAMPRGGRLTIRLENVVLANRADATDDGRRAGPHVRLTVSDTGEGMSEEVRERVFEPFFTTKEVGQGTGLGLSTVLSIVQSHGGFVDLESEPGRGTSFRVHLPVEGTPAPASNEPPAAAEPARGRGELLLVIDDEEAIRELTRHSLERAGFRVLLAANGAEAVELYRRLGPEIAAVLTDMAMPVMDGPATIAALRAIDPRVRILGSSGNAPQEGSRGSVGLRFVAKPYGAATLVTALRELLNSGP